MKSTMGILHALEFLEDALFSESHQNHQQHHHEHIPHPKDIGSRRQLAKRSATAQKRDSLSMGVYGFLSEDGYDDADEAERFQRSEQQERILPQHELHAHPIVQVGAILSLLMKIRVCTFSTFSVSAHVIQRFLSQVTKVLQRSKDEHQQPRHYFPMDSEEEEEDIEEEAEDSEEKMMEDRDMKSIMNEEDDMEGHGLHLSLFGEIVDEKVDHVEAGNISALPDRNVTELLFHPANLRFTSEEGDGGGSGGEDMTADQYLDLIARMNDIYRRIGKKLNSWRNKEEGVGGGKRSIKCDSTANTEICNLGSLVHLDMAGI